MNLDRLDLPLTRLLLVLAGPVLLGACARDESDEADSCPAGLLPGDLVISEIMANPSGEDAGGEWWEIHNASDLEIALDGLALTFSKTDGTDARTHIVDGSTVAPGGYLVVGNVAAEALPAHVDYGYGEALAELANAGGRLTISCGDAVIDEAAYVDPPDGASLGFTGTQAPDAIANDDLTKWCAATLPYEGEALGSPGGPNEACAGSGVPTECLENGQPRAVVSPQPGDLLVTEVMADPGAVADALGEWVEVLALADVDLNGLALGKADETGQQFLSSAECLRVNAGAHVLFAASIDGVDNGGLPDPDFLLDVGLANSDSSLRVAIGETELDVVAWSSAHSGEAWNLDPSVTTPAGNDDPQAWCDALAPYGAGDLGTPGAANSSCGGGPGEPCLAGEELRTPVAPLAGDLVITEVMADPAAVADGEGEWFELLVTADVDLNGVELGKVPGEPTQTLDAVECLSVTAGSRVLLAANGDAATNGGLPTVDFPLAVSLTNSTGSLFVGHQAAVLDEVVWADSSAGIAHNLDPDASTPEGNDDPEQWCAAESAYGDGDLGSPGAENVACAGGGDGTCEEEGVPRPIVTPTAGDLVITEIMPNPNAVSDADGEWFEVLVQADVDLNGLGLGRVVGDVDEVVDSVDCLAVTAGTRVVFARETDAGTNGGVAADHGFAFSLVNSDGGLVLSLGDLVLDEVTWASSAAGAARNLDPDSETATDNDLDQNWCDAVSMYGAGDLGTPGSSNSACIGGGDDECLDAGEPRPIDFAQAGDLVITEVLADPSAVTDAAGEWFEIEATAVVDVNGLQIGRVFPAVDLTVAAVDCISMAPGDHLLFARGADEALNGGLPLVDQTFSFSLVNSDGSLFLALADQLLDGVDWVDTTPGASMSLDPAAIDPLLNDDALAWCEGATPYGDGDLGTPAADNQVCP